MRKPKSTFVLEYKSGRRQKQSPNTSIWGAVDFTSLAREIEGELPVETGAKGEVAPDGNDSKRAALHQNSDRYNTELEVEAGLSEARALLTDGATSVAKPVVAQAVCRQAGEIATARTSGQGADLSPSALWKAEVHTDNLAFPSPETLPASPSDHVSRRDLAALDAENAQLKARLAQKLAVENCSLKKMLEQFLD